MLLDPLGELAARLRAWAADGREPIEAREKLGKWGALP